MSNRRFEGKTALVTGAASGIGEACALSLARDGARVAVADTDRELGEKVAAAITGTGGEAVFLEADVSSPEDVERMVADTVETFGRLDLAVNNAGIGGELNPTGQYSLEGWRRVIDVNLNGVFYCMRYEIPQMLRQGGGAIVNMASILGSVGFLNSPAYVAAKHAVVGLTKTAAMEYGKRGIRINSVGPAFIRTPLITGLGEETLGRLAELHALGRLGESGEVAGLVSFLCSEEASFLTGGYYLADGGYTAQ